MKLVIAADHAGYELKQYLLQKLPGLGHVVLDLGTHDPSQPDDYPDFAQLACNAIRRGEAARAILVCGSGLGVSITANKFPGIRAGLCHDAYSARQGVEHDDMNILCLGARLIDALQACELADTFLTATFSHGKRHQRRLTKLNQIEARLYHSDLTRRGTEMSNPLIDLQDHGQSPWYDNIERRLIADGKLQELITQDGLRGITSNPAIFEKAITMSSDYDDALHLMLQEQDADAKRLYEQLAIQDIQAAADVMAPVYTNTDKRDGYVSLEVSPYLAHDTDGTIAEARRLWDEVNRPNIMIKVPATPAGIPAIQQLISDGININVTLLFHMQRYEQVAEAYLSGLETVVAQGGDPAGIASVASFFISRIDSAIDRLLTDQLEASGEDDDRVQAQSLLGQIAIANAKLTYQRYQALFQGARWQALAGQGAHTQRLLWASTGTKNPDYRDVVYVEELIGQDTVNTLPVATFDAFRDHGVSQSTLETGLEVALHTMHALDAVGIDMQAVTDRLLDEGVTLFSEAFDNLLSAVALKREQLLGNVLPKQSDSLPSNLAAAVDASLNQWRVSGKVRQLWAQDATVWTNRNESQWLGWLGIIDHQLSHIERFRSLAKDSQTAGFAHVLLLGMGGSSLGPEVFRMTFGTLPGHPELHVLDSTDPAQIKHFEERIDLTNTLFIVASKSGGTLEPNIFKQYFFDRLQQVVGAEEAGRRFIAITDPGSALQQVAETDHFRHICFGDPSIGGRYSALSDFGMVPAAIMGINMQQLLDRAALMTRSCAAAVPPAVNPGVRLGTILGVLANLGRDKVTIMTSLGIWDFGAWLEQLLAESTGKDGKGLIPIDQEVISSPSVYGNDRLFVYVRLASAVDAAQDAEVEALKAAGQPVVSITLTDTDQLGGEMFRWEIATAVAGAIIGINPFDQPDVEASKVATKALTTAYEETGFLPSETPAFEIDGIKLFTDANNAQVLAEAGGEDPTLASYLRAHFNRLQVGDYFCLCAYIEMCDTHQKRLHAIRHRVRDTKHVATCLGYGPRFLHSTGQAYKGGPNSGVFLQITCDDAHDIDVPGQSYSFGVVKAAQARGDLQVLMERDRRALRLHLGSDVAAGLAVLQQAVDEALDGD